MLKKMLFLIHCLLTGDSSDMMFVFVIRNKKVEELLARSLSWFQIFFFNSGWIPVNNGFSVPKFQFFKPELEFQNMNLVSAKRYRNSGSNRILAKMLDFVEPNWSCKAS